MNRSKVIALDIETGPLPTDQLHRMMPEFEAPGNYKNPEAIQKAIWDKQQAWIDRAALSPETGQLLAFGFKMHNKPARMQFADSTLTERLLLEDLWHQYNCMSLDGYCFAGSNLIGFDIQFLKIRSIILGVELPAPITWARYGSEAGFFDLQDWWNFAPGQNRDKTSLNTMAKALGIPGKNGDGKFFHQMLKDDPEKAADYLENDLAMTEAVITRICPKTKPRVDV